MNSLYIVFAAGVFFFWAYSVYAKRLESLWQVDPKRATPAYSKYDSVDFIPAKNWVVLFGHHFASIAGAGPIIGPVIAVMLWGWLPALLWVVIGTTFIGGVHDFGALMTSVRHGGASVAEIAQNTISRRARVIFSLFVWLALILVIAVFSYLCADTFVKEPKVVVPSLGLIPVAMAAGYLLYYKRAHIASVTAFGLICLAGLVLLGNILPVRSSLTAWIIVLFGYCYFASVLPVNILLQPRDYLASLLLFFGIGIGYAGLLLSRPLVTMPLYHNWATEEGYLWPALFVTVACGAVSGFHALVSSGTSSKQIANERDAKKIGYGGMLAEGLVAILAVIAVAVLFNNKQDIAMALRTSTPIGVFAKGYGFITRGILGNNGPFIAIIILNAFILTTLDTATRISRYLAEELLRVKSRHIATSLVIALSAPLAITGKWNKIWPAFGASNQLVAALTLLVLSCWLLSNARGAKSGKYYWRAGVSVTLWPAFFMLITSVGALIFQLSRYILQGDILLAMITILLIACASFMLYEVIVTVFAKRLRYA